MELKLTPREEVSVNLIKMNAEGYEAFDNNEYQNAKSKEHISYSRLKNYAVSPAMGRLRDEEKIERTEAMKFGSLVHGLILTPDKQNYVVEEKRVALKKDGTPYANGQQDAEQKAEWEELAAKGIDVFSPEDYAKAECMARSAIRCINEAFPEITWDAERTYWCEEGIIDEDHPHVHLGTFDLVSNEHRIILDVKTISDEKLDDRTLRNHIFSYWYHGQAAWYDHLFKFKNDEGLAMFGFVFVSKSAPYHSKLFILDEADLAKAEETVDKAMTNLYADDTEISPVLPQSSGLYNNNY